MQVSSHIIKIFNTGPYAHKKIEIVSIHESYLYQHEEFLSSFVESACHANARLLGLAGAYIPCTSDNLRGETACLLSKIALASPDRVIIITLDFEPATADHNVLSKYVFKEQPDFQTIAFNADRLALRLYQDYGMELHNVIDMLSVNMTDIDTPRTARRLAEEYDSVFDVMVISDVLRDEVDLEDILEYIASQSWMACVLSQASEDLGEDLLAVQPVNLFKLPHEDRLELASLTLTGDRLKTSQEEFVIHEVKIKRMKGKLYAESLQYNTRIRMSEFKLQLKFENGQEVVTEVKAVKGRDAELTLDESIDLEEVGEVISARTLGPAEATTLDHQRENFILAVLQGKIHMRDNAFISQIWFPPKGSTQPRPPLAKPELLGTEVEKLNSSQKKAVEEMLTVSDEPRIVLVHGPPGTGKTSVIAAMTQSMLLADEEETVWIIAQSNVAIKNVAEKLVKIGLTDFKLIVSHEFYFQWHEDLYGEIIANTIKSTKITIDGDWDALIRGNRVILCTLSMISSPRIREAGVDEIVPVKNVVVDEASQIQLGDLLPLFHHFGSEMKRLCMVGDHKQLAPYGQDEISGLESIFEKEHIVKNAIMLNTTYRLPMPVWTTISNTVYDLKLFGWQEEEKPNCWRWINVEDGKEEKRQNSYVNQQEAEACVHAAKELSAKGLEYRVITPYAPQTALIRDMLTELNKTEPNVKFEDTCFNVDSFQGNEADYIIISLVRTEGIGFLANDRRSNVLLTRCKKGMYIFTNYSLITGFKGRDTLLGKVALAWTGERDNVAWPTYANLLEGLELAEVESKKEQRKKNRKTRKKLVL